MTRDERKSEAYYAYLTAKREHDASPSIYAASAVGEAWCKYLDAYAEECSRPSSKIVPFPRKMPPDDFGGAA